jgi:hypothetical protein
MLGRRLGAYVERNHGTRVHAIRLRAVSLVLGTVGVDDIAIRRTQMKGMGRWVHTKNLQRDRNPSCRRGRGR